MPPVQISRVLILVLAIMVSAATDTHAPMLMNALMDLTTVQTTPVVPIILVVLNVMLMLPVATTLVDIFANVAPVSSETVKLVMTSMNAMALLVKLT